MIRLVITVLFVTIFLICSIPIFLVELIIDKIAPGKTDLASLRIVQWAFRVVGVLSGVKMTEIGKDNIPKDEAVLFIANHRGVFDIVMTYGYLPRLTGFLSKESNFKIPLLATWMRRLHCIPLKRESGKDGLKAILKAIELVKSDVSVMIFPEGTRNRNPQEGLLEFKEGSFKVATKTGCKIVPVAITNTEAVLDAHKPWIRSAKIIIEYGTPIDPADFSKEEQKTIGAYTQNIIAGMLEKHSL